MSKTEREPSDNVIEQMVDGIVGKGKGDEETRRRLAGRAAEYFMFLDDDEEIDDSSPGDASQS